MVGPDLRGRTRSHRATFWIQYSHPTPAHLSRSLFPHMEEEVLSSRVQPNPCLALCLMSCTGCVIKAHRSSSRSSILCYYHLLLIVKIDRDHEFPRFPQCLKMVKAGQYSIMTFLLLQRLWVSFFAFTSTGFFSATPCLRLFLNFCYCIVQPNYIGKQTAHATASLESWI